MSLYYLSSEELPTIYQSIFSLLKPEIDLLFISLGQSSLHLIDNALSWQAEAGPRGSSVNVMTITSVAARGILMPPLLPPLPLNGRLLTV